MKRLVYLIPHNHFDPTWRRCFDRDAVYQGVTVRSYAEVEAHCFNAWLELAPRGYTYHEGQTAVLRKYLERHPAQREALRQYAAAGQLDIILAGEVVQDTVLSSAEGLVRNFLVALPLYQELVGLDHPALKIASLEDAFGNSPNYPQVLKGVGAEVAGWLSYRPCPEHIWVGIDGTPMPTLDRHPAGFAGAFAKHLPCPHCQGAGCTECDGTGLRFVDGFDLPELAQAITDALAANSESDWVAIRFLTEEVLPDARVVAFVEAWNREHDDAEIRFANPLDVYRLHRPTLEAALAERDATPSVDLNPAMPGCMVTRIRCKQRTRATAYRLLAAEAALANRLWADGAPAAQPADLTQAWRGVAFNQFHDAITGTHIDSAFPELMEMLDQAEAAAVRHHTPAVRPADTGTLAVVKTPEATVKLGALEVTFDRFGIRSILRDGVDVFGDSPAPWNNRNRRARIAELVLEPDYGDAWGKRIGTPDPAVGALDFSTVLLGNYHTGVQASDRALRWQGRYTGGDPRVKTLVWTVTATPSADGNRLEFVTDVEWDTHSRRLRVLVPVKSTDPTATYEVPYGFIDRTFDKTKLDFSIWGSNTQEFPTLHWICKAIDEQRGVVLFNKGLPCNRWLPGTLDLSLVRSPEYAFCIVEPGSYEFWDIDGQRDTGTHRFEYALYPYYTGMAFGDLVRLGYAYNLPAPLQPPFAISGDVVVTAWKPAESGDGWVLRLQEAGGAGTIVRLTFDETRRVTPTNLLEQPQGETVTTTAYEAPLHKHGLLTMLIR